MTTNTEHKTGTSLCHQQHRDLLTLVGVTKLEQTTCIKIFVGVTQYHWVSVYRRFEKIFLGVTQYHWVSVYRRFEKNIFRCDAVSLGVYRRFEKIVMPPF
jgi:hypothetical protein